MSRRRAIRGIDFERRPKSYWSTAKERDAKRLRTYDRPLVDKIRDRSGRDLRAFPATEVEIVRLQLTETIHEEVTSIRARRVGGRITYRIVSEVLTEYGYQFKFSPCSSTLPLTLGMMIEIIDNAQVIGPDGKTFPKGLVISAWEHQLTECENTDPESLKNWIDVSSEYYPDLKHHYQRVFVQWALAKNLIQPDDKQAQR